MRAALLSFSRRSGAADLVARYGAGRLALVVVPHIIALVIMLATETHPVEIAAFLLAWGILNFFWLAPSRRRRAVAGGDDGVGAALRSKIPRADDDGELRRPDDHRHRHCQLPVHDLSGVALDRGAVPRRAGAAGGVHLAGRSVPRPPADRGRGSAGLRRRAYGGRETSAAAAVRGVLWRQSGVVLRALRRRRNFGTADARPHGVRRLRCRPPAADWRGQLRAGKKTAAHYSHPRRVEF